MTTPGVVTEEAPETPVEPSTERTAPAEPKGRFMASLAGALFLASLALDPYDVYYVRAGLAVDTSPWDLLYLTAAIVGAAGAFTLAFTKETRLAPPIAVLAAVVGLFFGFLPFFSGYVAPIGDVRLLPDFGSVALLGAGGLALWSGMRALGRFRRNETGGGGSA